MASGTTSSNRTGEPTAATAAAVRKHVLVLSSAICDIFMERHAGRPRRHPPSASDDEVCENIGPDHVRRYLYEAVERGINDSKEKRALQNLLLRDSDCRRELELEIATAASTDLRRDDEVTAVHYGRSLEPAMFKIITKACPGCRTRATATAAAWIPDDHPVCHTNLTASIERFLDAASRVQTRRFVPQDAQRFERMSKNDAAFRELVKATIYKELTHVPTVAGHTSR